jgi:hypothetical protein
MGAVVTLGQEHHGNFALHEMAPSSSLALLSGCFGR